MSLFQGPVGFPGRSHNNAPQSYHGPFHRTIGSMVLLQGCNLLGTRSLLFDEPPQKDFDAHYLGGLFSTKVSNQMTIKDLEIGLGEEGVTEPFLPWLDLTKINFDLHSHTFAVQPTHSSSEVDAHTANQSQPA